MTFINWEGLTAEQEARLRAWEASDIERRIAEADARAPEPISASVIAPLNAGVTAASHRTYARR